MAKNIRDTLDESKQLIADNPTLHTVDEVTRITPIPYVMDALTDWATKPLSDMQTRHGNPPKGIHTAREQARRNAKKTEQGTPSLP